MHLLFKHKICKIDRIPVRFIFLTIICGLVFFAFTACSQAEAYQTTAPVSTTSSQPAPIQSINNRLPVIENLTSDALEVKKATQVNLHCTASDPDGDVLNYTWESTGGNVIGEGLEATWIAPNNYADYTIKVTVDDGRGGSTSRELTIKVSCMC